MGAPGVSRAASFPSSEVCSHCAEFPIQSRERRMSKELPVRTPSRDTFVVLAREGKSGTT